VTSLEDLPIRPDLVGLKPYGAPQLSVPVSLNVNENTHQIPEAVAVDIIGRLAESLLSINRYPDREFVSLRQALADYLNDNVGSSLNVVNIWAGNGSNEVLQHIFQAFGGPGRVALGFKPTYSMYKLIAQVAQTEYVEAARDARFELSVQTVQDGIRANQPNVVMLCSPNNPTGTPVSLEVINAAYDVLQETTGGILVVDEAYAEFAHDHSQSAITLLEGRPKLLVSRTMSKAFAFAGARVGYLAADPAVIDALRLVRLPYHLSAFTQAAAEGALAHSAAMLQTVDEIRVQRDRIVAELTEMGLDPYRTDSNFVLFAGLNDSQAVWQKLLDRGVLVRDMGIVGTLRVSAGTESETTLFLAALREIIGA
jgi:histidinol-phosphate aminotransferase